MAITDNSSLKARRGHNLRDIQPISSRLNRLWKSPFAALIPVCGAAAIYAIPGYSLLTMTMLSPLCLINYKIPIKFPAKVPKSIIGQKIDVGSLKAGSENEFNQPLGITCLGVDRETGVQVFEDSDNERRHSTILATTGSGKTFSLRMHIAMALVQTTGLIAVDGKGDIELPLEVASILRRMGRENDLRIINFKQGGQNIYAETATPRTNTFNPFSKGSTSYIAEVLKSLLSQDDPKAGKGDMWAKRAEGMVDLIAKIATYKRDHGDFKIRPGTLRDFLYLKALCEVYLDEAIPEDYKAGLKTYFQTLPSLNFEKMKAYVNGEEFDTKTLEQHGYVAMQLQPALQVLADQYGYIFDTDTPEVDLKDVVINNRVLLVLLPAMEVSEGTLRNTGKIILAALKGMIAGELGPDYEGNLDEILSARSCRDPAPFKVFFDECGYYAAIPGIEILPAQGRGIGFAFYFIGQTYTDLEKGGAETAEIVWGNTNNKTIGKTESDKTYEKVAARVHEVEVLEQETVVLKDGVIGTSRVRADSLHYKMRKRLSMSDLTSLREGQYFHISNDSLISLQTGDPVIKGRVKETRYNQLVGLTPIDPGVQKALRRDHTAMLKFLKAGLSGKPIMPVKLEGVPKVAQIIALMQTARAVGNLTGNAPLIDWQAVIHATNEITNNKMNAKVSSETRAILNEALAKLDAQPAAVKSTPKSDKSKAGTESGQAITPPPSINDLDVPAEETWAAAAERIARTSTTAIAQRDDEDEYEEDDDTAFEKTLNDDDDEMVQADEVQMQREYMDYLLKVGNITKEQYAEAIYQLENNSDQAGGSDDTDSMIEVDYSSDPFAGVALDQTIVEPTKDDKTLTDMMQKSLLYPSGRTDSFAKKMNAEKVKELLDTVENTFNLDFS